jgi:hypothetical protein
MADILKSSENNSRCCKSLQRQLIGGEPCTLRNIADFSETDMDTKTEMDTGDMDMDMDTEMDTGMNTDMHKFY